VFLWQLHACERGRKRRWLDGGRFHGGRFDGGWLDGGWRDGGRFRGGRFHGRRFERRRLDGGWRDGGRFHGRRFERRRFDGGGSTAGGATAGGSTAGGSSAGGSTAGFRPEPGFTVTAAAGFSHGACIVVTRAAGAWAPRTYGEHPWLYDVGDAQYLGGTQLDAMAGVANATEVPVTVSNGVWVYGAAMHRVRLARASRPAPNARTHAWWYSTTGADNMKTVLGAPRWPSTWNGGVQNNRRLYVSWWFRMKFAYTSGEPFRGKHLRYNATDGSAIGSCQFNPDTLQHPGGTMYDTAPASLASTWYRNELYVDLDADAVDAYSQYRYVRQFNQSGTTKGPHEFRRDDNFLYTLSSTGNVPFIEPWTNVTVGSLGYDGQSGAVHGGQEHDVANVYVDTEWQRFEVSDSPAWDLSPNPFSMSVPGAPREVQGRWRRVSDTVAEVFVNQGQFASLSGKYLWYVDGLKTAVRIGQFQ
jgi:hypothetical protein